MKLEDIKDRIDSFFDNITPEELYDMAVNEYGFRDITYDVEDEVFETSDIVYYPSEQKSQKHIAENNQTAINNLIIAA